MKRFLPLLILTGLLFGQDVLNLKSGEYFEGTFYGKVGEEIVFKIEGKTKTNRYSINDVETITTKTGELNYPFETPNEQIAKYDVSKEEPFKSGSGFGVRKIGGLLIGISGAMLYSINNRELEKDFTIEEFDDFVEKQQSDGNLAYTLLAVGGFLIALDQE